MTVPVAQELVSLTTTPERTMPARCLACGAKRVTFRVVAGALFPAVRVRTGGRRVYVEAISHADDCPRWTEG